MNIKNKFLFNFAVSQAGGGYKRLFEYAKWFDQNGGAAFVIHPRCQDVILKFKNNHFFIATQPRYQRLFQDCVYLKEILKTMGEPEFYYSYGIPIYGKVGKVNWFHLSNVLPLAVSGVPLSLFDRLKLGYLGRRIRANLKNADIISAESNYSLSLMDQKYASQFQLSVNGSDDELKHLRDHAPLVKENIATMVGTYLYKAVVDSYFVFKMMQKNNPTLKLIVIGYEKGIPDSVKSDPDVIAKGLLPRSEVVEVLKKTRYYISTTHIENSYNAASEGVFFAEESYISDIGPHRELLLNLPYQQISIPQVERKILFVRRSDITGLNLKSWDQVILDMLARVRSLS